MGYGGFAAATTLINAFRIHSHKISLLSNEQTNVGFFGLVNMCVLLLVTHWIRVYFIGLFNLLDIIIFSITDDDHIKVIRLGVCEVDKWDWLEMEFSWTYFT